MTTKILVLWAIMTGTTYLVRMIPFLLFRKKIESPFIQSMLCYMPYAILISMTFPAVFYCTGDIRTAIPGFAAALALALKGKSLTLVALAACLAALAAWGLLLVI